MTRGRPETAGKNPGDDAGRVGRHAAKVSRVAAHAERVCNGCEGDRKADRSA